LPFARAKTGPFLQEEPTLHNQYLSDSLLQSYLKRVIPKEILHEIEPDLVRFGERVATDVYELSLDCERNPPSLVQYNAWGRRVDKIVTCEAWKKMKVISAEEGLIALAYDRKHNEFSRLHQAAKLFLFNPSSGLYGCPLAMTDGAAKTIEAMSLKQLNPAFRRLTSRDPAQFWTAGQWMTERGGGSDVANGTETLAVLQPDGSYRLYGYKWFSSATDSDMTLTLARVLDADGATVKGSKGLSMFYLETKDKDGNSNNIDVVKLKNKLGTRQLPTAELLLDGCVAYKVSDEGRGVAAIANVLTITRIHNALSSVAAMRRILSLARDYGTKRQAFGRLIGEYPLHVQTQARMEIEARGCGILAFEVSRLLGREDCNVATDEEKHLLRLLTPIAKLFAAKQAMGVVSEGLEMFGGQGYIEDTGIPAIYRDAQVTPIWEGTTNILSLDVLRATFKSKGEVLLAFQASVLRKLALAQKHQQLEEAAGRVGRALKATGEFVQNSPDFLENAARDLSFTIARIYIGALLLEHAAWSGARTDVLTANRWCDQDLTACITEAKKGSYLDAATLDDKSLVMDCYLGKY